MPSLRRTKALLVALVTVLALTLFMVYHSPAPYPYLRTLRTVTEAERLAASAPPPPAAVYVEARAEITALLQQHAVVVFSKSYCPYSKKAKALLLEKYTIVPPPFVVELDLKANGMQVQKELEAITGRATVPVGSASYPGRAVGANGKTECLGRGKEHRRRRRRRETR